YLKIAILLPSSRLSCLMILPSPRSTLFPYTTLFRSGPAAQSAGSRRHRAADAASLAGQRARAGKPGAPSGGALFAGNHRLGRDRDRKSTRLNSSHVKISYAVFCLKKKKLEQHVEI